MSLRALLDDVDKVLSTWPTAPFVERRDPAAFTALLSREEVDALVDEDCLGMRNVALLKDGKPVERYLYADGDTPRRGYLRRHLDEGGTLSLRSLERLKPSIAELHRQITAELGYPVHVNAYYTPGGAQGLHYHYDPYVTLILQLSGRKVWPTHPPFVRNPLYEYQSFHRVGFSDEQLRYLASTPPAETYELFPGSVFWLPRGFVHAPYVVGEAPSLHLTIALKERTFHWAASQLAYDVLQLALADEEMREAVPPVQLTQDAALAARDMRDYLIGALLHLGEDEAAEILRQAARRK